MPYLSTPHLTSTLQLAAQAAPKRGPERTVGKVDVKAFHPPGSKSKALGRAGRPPQIEIPRGPEVVYERKPEDDVDSDDGADEPEPEPEPPKPVVPRMARAADGRAEDNSWNDLHSAGSMSIEREDVANCLTVRPRRGWCRCSTHSTQESI